MERPITIATWNVERPHEHSSSVPAINAVLARYSPDILVLTETHECIVPGPGYQVLHSDPLDNENGGTTYRKGERRVSIWTKFPLVKHLAVTDPLTTAGPLAVFGCIMGVKGRGEGFDRDLMNQMVDLRRLAREYPVCYAGDLNLSFSDNYYTKKSARSQLGVLFSLLKKRNLTAEVPENIDHIIVSEAFFRDTAGPVTCWNEDKKLSDHKGVMVAVRT